MNVQHTVHYDAQRRKQSEGHYLKGTALPYGPWTFWYEDGTVMQEGDYGDDGLQTGPWTYYWRNGKKQGEGTYAHGQKVGLWLSWYENGRLQRRGNYVDGHKNGPWQHWNAAGVLSTDGAYVKGQRHGPWRFHLDTPAYAFETEWYLGKMTNHAGKPPEQPAEDRGVYYPVVPGQLPRQERPFDRDGVTDNIFFGCLESGRRFTYLFKPVSPFTNHDPAGLTLVIGERYQTLLIFEKRFAAFPDKTYDDQIVSLSKESEPQQAHPMIQIAPSPSEQKPFMVVVDPHAQVERQRGRETNHGTLQKAIKSAIRHATRKKVRTVVGRFMDRYPLDF